MTKKYIEDTDIDIGTFTSGTLTLANSDGSAFYASGDFTGVAMNDFCFGDVKYSFATVRDGVLQYGIPASAPCPYCGTRGGEDKYHSGTCANCGAVL